MSGNSQNIEATDLISRKALLDEMNYMFRDDDIPISPMDAKLLAQDAPAIEAEPVRHGRWLFDDFDGDGLDYQCSVCKSYTRSGYRYCPNCGAKMDG